MIFTDVHVQCSRKSVSCNSVVGVFEDIGRLIIRKAPKPKSGKVIFKIPFTLIRAIDKCECSNCDVVHIEVFYGEEFDLPSFQLYFPHTVVSTELDNLLNVCRKAILKPLSYRPRVGQFLTSLVLDGVAHGDLFKNKHIDTDSVWQLWNSKTANDKFHFWKGLLRVCYASTNRDLLLQDVRSLDDAFELYERLLYNGKCMKQIAGRTLAPNDLIDLSILRSSNVDFTSDFESYCDHRNSPPSSITAGECLTFLFSEDNALTHWASAEFTTQLVSLPRSAVRLDLPMTDYFISSSHNTYLVGQQVLSKSCVEAYIHCMRMGCRCLELDLWNSNDSSQVKVTHGYCLVKSVPFVDVLLAIKRYAFEYSDLPMILSIEDHLSLANQSFVATKLREILGDMLLTKTMGKAGRMPTLAEVGRKIIIKHHINAPASSENSLHSFTAKVKDALSDLWFDEDVQVLHDVVHYRDTKKFSTKNETTAAPAATSMSSMRSMSVAGSLHAIPRSWSNRSGSVASIASFARTESTFVDMNSLADGSEFSAADVDECDIYEELLSPHAMESRMKMQPYFQVIEANEHLACLQSSLRSLAGKDATDELEGLFLVKNRTADAKLPIDQMHNFTLCVYVSSLNRFILSHINIDSHNQYYLKLDLPVGVQRVTFPIIQELIDYYHEHDIQNGKSCDVKTRLTTPVAVYCAAKEAEGKHVAIAAVEKEKWFHPNPGKDDLTLLSLVPGGFFVTSRQGSAARSRQEWPLKVIFNAGHRRWLAACIRDMSTPGSRMYSLQNVERHSVSQLLKHFLHHPIEGDHYLRAPFFVDDMPGLKVKYMHYLAPNDGNGTYAEPNELLQHIRADEVYVSIVNDLCLAVVNNPNPDTSDQLAFFRGDILKFESHGVAKRSEESMRRKSQQVLRYDNFRASFGQQTRSVVSCLHAVATITHPWLSNEVSSALESLQLSKWFQVDAATKCEVLPRSAGIVAMPSGAPRSAVIVNLRSDNYSPTIDKCLKDGKDETRRKVARRVIAELKPSIYFAFETEAQALAFKAAVDRVTWTLVESMSNGSIKVDPELEKLVVYMQCSSFKEINEKMSDSKLTAGTLFKRCISIEENVAIARRSLNMPTDGHMFSHEADFCQRYSQMVMLRSYPNKWKVRSENYDPVPFWRLGVQMVALNFQTADRFRQFNEALFRATGRCGYVPKPSSMRVADGTKMPLAKTTSREQSGSVELHVSVIGARRLAGPVKAIEVETHGCCEVERGKFETDGAENGFNPCFSDDDGLNDISSGPDVFRFTVHHQELTFLRFNVVADVSGDVSLGQFTTRVRDIRPGYRSVPLYDAHFRKTMQTQFSSLLVKIAVLPIATPPPPPPSRSDAVMSQSAPHVNNTDDGAADNDEYRDPFLDSSATPSHMPLDRSSSLAFDRRPLIQSPSIASSTTSLSPKQSVDGGAPVGRIKPRSRLLPKGSGDSDRITSSPTRPPKE